MGAVAAYLQLRGDGTRGGDRRVPSPASLYRGASPPSAPLFSGPSGGKPSGRGLWVQTVPAPLTQECREQQGGLCAAPAPSQCPQPGPPPAPAPRFPPCFFLVLFAGAAAHKNVPRQHKRPQRAKFLSAVGKEETGAVVYREVRRFSPRSPFSPPRRRCMTANSPPGLPLDLFLFFLSFFIFFFSLLEAMLWDGITLPTPACWPQKPSIMEGDRRRKRRARQWLQLQAPSSIGAAPLQPQLLVASLPQVSGAPGICQVLAMGPVALVPKGVPCKVLSLSQAHQVKQCISRFLLHPSKKKKKKGVEMVKAW